MMGGIGSSRSGRLKSLMSTSSNSASVRFCAISYTHLATASPLRPGRVLPMMMAILSINSSRAVSAVNGLHLCEAAIHKQFRSRDVAAVVGREKHHGLGDLIGCTEPAERNTVRNEFHAFLGRFYGMPWGRVGIARADRVHANATILQVRGPCPRERTHSGFCGAINTPLGRDRCTGDGGRIQDDRGAIRQQRKRLLYREKQAFHIAVKERVVMLLSDLAQGGELRATGIRKHNIELALLPFDLREETIEIAKVRHVSLYAGYISS